MSGPTLLSSSSTSQEASPIEETKKKFSKSLLDAHRTGELEKVFSTFEEKAPTAEKTPNMQRGVTQVLAEGPKKTSKGMKGLQRFQQATSKVQEANRMLNAIEGITGGATTDPDALAARRQRTLNLAKITAERERFRNKSKTTATHCLLLVLFLDSLGPWLMMGNAPSLFCPPIEGATESQLAGGMGIWYLNGDVERFPFGQGSPQAQAATTIQCSQSIVLFCQGFACTASSRLGKMVGRKGALGIFTFVGAVMYMFAGLSGQFLRGREGGMYIYLACRGLTGLFAGSQPVVASLIADIWETAKPEVKQQKNMLIMFPVIAAVALGPVVAVFLGPMTDNLFFPLFVGGACEIIAGILVFTVIPHVPRPKKKTNGAAAPGAEKPRGFQKWIVLFWFARFFDRSGFGHIQYLMSVLKMPPVSWPMLQDVHIFNYLLVLVAVVFICITQTLGKWASRFGLGFTCVIGNSTAGMLFFVLATAGLIGGFFAYVPIMMVLVYFYGIATMFTNPMIIALAPVSERDRWVGYQAAFQNVAQAVCPFVALPFMTLETAGTLWDGAYLRACGTSCLLSGICYLLLASKKFPPPPKTEPMSEATKQALEDYEMTGSIRWLPASEIRKINQELVKAGKQRLNHAFGSFEEDAGELDRISDLAKQDFPQYSKFLQDCIRKWTTGTDHDREELRKLTEAIDELMEWSKVEEAAFAEWTIAWLKYCGYLRPGLNPRFWKSMMMEAFPRILEGETREEGLQLFKENPVPAWTRENNMMKGYMKVLKHNEAAVKALSKLDASMFQ